MTIFPWKPIRLSSDIETEIEKAFASLIHEPWGGTRRRPVWQPDIDIYETDEAYVVLADLPGVKPENLKVQVEDHCVTISGSRESATWIQSAHGVSLERRQGSFSRRFHLDQPIDPERVEDSCEEGIYHIRLPKKRKTPT